MLRPVGAGSIFAVASGSGRSAIAVVRLTGPATRKVLRSLLGRLPEPRQANLMALRDPDTGDLLDRGLVLWFPGPNSFTGEDAAEFQVHGGRAVVRGLLEALGRRPDLRLAEPGEFARRAFRNGKLDANAVEALADLIDADTQVQRRLALRQLDGALGRWAQDVRSLLVDALALSEGAIDFAEDDDLRGPFEREVRLAIATARQRIADELSAAERSARAREGLLVAITGAPNVGKSTLLNALVGREVAIVSVHAGTTRDPIEVDLELGGHAVRLVDTAGLRDTSDPVEQEGMARARARAAAADVVLWLHDRPASPADLAAATSALWSVATKLDRAEQCGPADFAVSAKTGEGLDRLLDALRARASELASGSEVGAVSQLRHRASLLDALTFLDRALMVDAASAELIAEELRLALGALERLTGAVDTEEVLGSIFARFCIGK